MTKMKKKIRVDFSAHCSVVVSVKESDTMYDDAITIAEHYVEANPIFRPDWEVDDGGVSDADADEEAIND